MGPGEYRSSWHGRYHDTRKGLKGTVFKKNRYIDMFYIGFMCNPLNCSATSSAPYAWQQNRAGERRKHSLLTVRFLYLSPSSE
ncbi:hypothetical protein FKM82_015198 [Ascaphus truei]